jgi:hypothetical protein
MFMGYNLSIRWTNVQIATELEHRFFQYGRSKKQGLVHSFRAKIEVAVIEDEGGTTHVKQTSTFKYGDRKQFLSAGLVTAFSDPGI